jgi:phosphoglycerol transferase MdoB-like AlkP superfamily enzyme
MRKSALEVLVSEDYGVFFGLGLLVVAGLLCLSKKEPASAYFWLPLFVMSIVFTLPAMVGCAAGGYGGLVFFAYWSFPLASVVFCFAKPSERAFGTKALIGTLAVIALLLALFLIPTSVKKYAKKEPNRVAGSD